MSRDRSISLARRSRREAAKRAAERVGDAISLGKTHGGGSGNDRQRQRRRRRIADRPSTVTPMCSVTSTWCVLTSRMRAPPYPGSTRRQELAGGGRSPYVEQSFARVVSPSPSWHQGSTRREQVAPLPGKSLPQLLSTTVGPDGRLLRYSVIP